MKRDMRKYILRKLVELIFTLLFVTLLSFLLMRLSSVDPATAYLRPHLRRRGWAVCCNGGSRGLNDVHMFLGMSKVFLYPDTISRF